MKISQLHKHFREKNRPPTFTKIPNGMNFARIVDSRAMLKVAVKCTLTFFECKQGHLKGKGLAGEHGGESMSSIFSTVRGQELFSQATRKEKELSRLCFSQTKKHRKYPKTFLVQHKYV